MLSPQVLLAQFKGYLPYHNKYLPYQISNLKGLTFIMECGMNKFNKLWSDPLSFVEGQQGSVTDDEPPSSPRRDRSRASGSSRRLGEGSPRHPSPHRRSKDVPEDDDYDIETGHERPLTPASSPSRSTASSRREHAASTASYSWNNLATRIRSFGTRSKDKEEDDGMDLCIVDSQESDDSGSGNSNTAHTASSSSSEEDNKLSGSANDKIKNSKTIIIEDVDRVKRKRHLKSAHSSKRQPKSIDHFEAFGHGKLWTILGLIFTWTGFFLSIRARKVTDFVELGTPMYIDPMFETVSSVGMVNLELCYNTTYSGTAGCLVHELASDDVNDRTFQIARSVAFLAILLGGFTSIVFTSATYWNTINLRPLGLAYLFAYFFQSFTFLFFDTDLCSKYTCRIGKGCFFSIFASLCWIVACFAASRMDIYMHRRKMELKRREAYRKAREAKRLRKSEKLVREESNTTADTHISSGSSIDVEDFVLVQEVKVPVARSRSKERRSKSVERPSSTKRQGGTGRSSSHGSKEKSTRSSSQKPGRKLSRSKSSVEIERKTPSHWEIRKAASTIQDGSSKRRRPSPHRVDPAGFIRGHAWDREDNFGHTAQQTRSQKQSERSRSKSRSRQGSSARQPPGWASAENSSPARAARRGATRTSPSSSRRPRSKSRSSRRQLEM